MLLELYTASIIPIILLQKATLGLRFPSRTPEPNTKKTNFLRLKLAPRATHYEYYTQLNPQDTGLDTGRQRRQNEPKYTD